MTATYPHQLRVGTDRVAAIHGPTTDLTLTLKASGEYGLNTGGGSPVAGALGAIAFAADSLVVVVLGGTKASNLASETTCTATGLTFTARATADQLSASKAEAVILTAPHAAGGSTTITITTGARSSYGLLYAIYEVTGHHATPIGATATQADNLTNGAKTMTLSAAPAADSIVLAAVAADADPGASSIDPGSTFTESVEVDSIGSNYGVMQVQTRTGSTSTTVDWADVRAASSPGVYSTAGVAVEIVKG